jgi:hypothetical protein
MRSTNKVVWTDPSQIPRFALLSTKIVAELAGRETLSFDLELTQCLIRERKFTFLETTAVDEATGLDETDISLDPVGKHVARFLSSDNLRASVTAFVAAVRHAGWVTDNDPEEVTTLVRQWRTMLTMQRNSVIPDVRRRLQNVFLGKEFSRRLRCLLFASRGC